MNRLLIKMLYNNEYLQIADEFDLRSVRKRNESVRYGHNAFGLADREFVKTYRLTKHLTRSLISEISPYMPVNLRSDGIDTETKILVALAFFASGSYQTLVGQSSSHSISQPSVSRAIKQVTEVLNLPHIFNKYVRFPNTREDREEIKRGFYRRFGMVGALGCIDGTHIAIVTPLEHEERFFNRKGYHSLNALIICDSEAKIMCVDASNPGSTHDSAAWNNNPLKLKLEEIIQTSSEDFYLLGDSGFPLRRTLMTPILNAAPNTPEALYTEKHMITRNVVERCIGILKARFRCLLVDRKLHYKPNIAAKITNACCVLHNIALHDPDYTAETEEALQRDQTQQLEDAQLNTTYLRADQRNRDLQEGRRYQQALVQRLSRRE